MKNLIEKNAKFSINILNSNLPSINEELTIKIKSFLSLIRHESIRMNPDFPTAVDTSQSLSLIES